MLQACPRGLVIVLKGPSIQSCLEHLPERESARHASTIQGNRASSRQDIRRVVAWQEIIPHKSRSTRSQGSCNTKQSHSSSDAGSPEPILPLARELCLAHDSNLELRYS